MTQKKKAELQRKLSMSAVPTPPTDLARRIKADIPNPLITMKADRERFSNSIAFSMRVAASVILLLTSAVLSFHLVSRGEVFSNEKKTEVQSAPSATAPASDSVVPTFADTATITVAVAQDSDMSAEALSKEAAPPRAQSAAVENSAELRRSRIAAPQQVARVDATAGRAVIGATAGAVAREEQVEASRDVAVPPPVVTAPAAPPPPPPAPAAAERTDAADFVAEPIVVTAQSPVVASAPVPMPMTVTSPSAAESRTSAKASVGARRSNSGTAFGLSIDPGEFARIKSMIESGRKPSEAVDVEALVNHFAGTTAPVMKAVRLQVEGSRLPIARDNSLVMLRYTIDTAAPSRRAAGPVGTDAKIEVILNRNALLRFRVIGDTPQLEVSEGTLPRGLSVTGLVEMRIKPGIAPRDEIATVRLTYRSAADGSTKTEAVSIKAGDLNKNWTGSTRRHRLATLGAVWGESLRADAAADEVARAAEGLAHESPNDARARELAAAATASSRLRSSGPTGSGR